MMRGARRQPPRSGFTLIELLVVMTLMAVLAGLAIFAYPRASTQAREAQAGQQLQGWLSAARQQAIRDQAPTGLRLYFTRADAAAKQVIVKQCEYVQQPDDFTGGTIQTAADNAVQVTFAGGVSLQNGYPGEPQNWSVRPGDYLQILGTGLMYRIEAITGDTTLTVAAGRPIRFQVQPTSNYRILRTPRPSGEEPMDLPEETVIDLTTNYEYRTHTTELNLKPKSPFLYPTEVSEGYTDILFSPSGELLDPRGSSQTVQSVNLWVRQYDPAETTADYSRFYKGDPTIIAVFVRSGLVAAYPPDAAGLTVGPPPGNPYALIR